MTSLKHKLATFLDDVAGRLRRSEMLAAVTVKVDDGPDGLGLSGWSPLTKAGPHDRDFSEWYQDQEDALEAWRKNFLVRRLVTLTRSYVLGGGITLSSGHRYVQSFLEDFVTHPQNNLMARLGPMCDELTRAGELFPVLFTNRVDGMSYLRFVPASQIREIETDPDDYETELRYNETEPGALEGKWWLGTSHPTAWEVNGDGGLPPVMLHYAVNRPIGATRGEGDLGPILRWALRYSNWLEDRVRLNRVRTRQQMLEIQLADDTKVRERKRQVETEDPIRAGIYVHGPGEEVISHDLKIGADDASADGKALRLAIAAGANVALHYMGEGESTNYATAKEMGEPTARFYTERQDQFCQILLDIIRVAYQRKASLGLATLPANQDYKLRATATETARADNNSLAEAAHFVTQALQLMKYEGWVDDATATRLAFKFAGEPLSELELEEILDRAREERPQSPPQTPPTNDQKESDNLSAGEAESETEDEQP